METEIISFGNTSKQDKKLLKKFVNFHWKHYKNDPQYIPLLDYEYLGFKLIGITGFFEPRNLFFKHADMRFFLALRGGEIVGRCNVFVNHNHNKHWNDKIGFFGQFESVHEQKVTNILLDSAAQWLRSQGMNRIRGPQNLPVNDATPGIMTDGFNSRPVMYYHYNKPYYQELLENAGFKSVKRVVSWEVDVMRPMEEKLLRICEKIVKRYSVTIEPWGARNLDERKREMLLVYNAAWDRNFGFVPFTEEEFSSLIDDMLLIMDKELFVFVYVKGELAGFFGGVPNVTEFMKPVRGCRRCEFFRALKMLLNAKRTKGFRLGYLGVHPRFQRMGLDGVMIWQQKKYVQKHKYAYCDMGWTLEDNKMVVRIVNIICGQHSKTYTIYEKNIK